MSEMRCQYWIVALFLLSLLFAGSGFAGNTGAVTGGIDSGNAAEDSSLPVGTDGVEDADQASFEVDTSERVFAYGDDGFRLTGKDVDFFRMYLHENNMGTTPKNYLTGALELHLYAKEAEALGLDQVYAEPLAAIDDPFDRIKFLAARYLSKVRAEYPVPEIVLESYRRAYPDRFQEYDEESGAYRLRPLDAEVREKIRRFIVKTKAQRIRSEELDSLKAKYNVVVCDPQEGCK